MLPSQAPPTKSTRQAGGKSDFRPVVLGWSNSVIQLVLSVAISRSWAAMTIVFISDSIPSTAQSALQITSCENVWASLLLN